MDRTKHWNHLIKKFICLPIFIIRSRRNFKIKYIYICIKIRKYKKTRISRCFLPLNGNHRNCEFRIGWKNLQEKNEEIRHVSLFKWGKPFYFFSFAMAYPFSISKWSFLVPKRAWKSKFPRFWQSRTHLESYFHIFSYYNKAYVYIRNIKFMIICFSIVREYWLFENHF